MKTFNWASLNSAQRSEILARPSGLNELDKTDSVQRVLESVKAGGDKAVRSFTTQFDGVDLEDFQVPLSDCKRAWTNLDKEDQKALQVAKSNIEAFHSAQSPQSIEVETMPGVVCRREPRAIQSAGLYIPGGTAPLVSTVLMLAIPARIAGVDRRIVVTPPGPDGQVNPAILAAAYLCEATDIFAIGGAQAIAALAYGTETVPQCDKIFGPGNAYVAIAKSLVSQEPGGPAIDLPAGPSEAMVIADETANPVFAASDLLSQAEHDTLAQVLCICTSEQVAANIQTEIDRQLESLPRKTIAAESLKNGRMIIAADDEMITNIVNIYAPEHLIIQTQNPDKWVPKIRNTGSIFLGDWTPESVGDYASGTNHTLPTYGAAKAYSGVTLESFIKYVSVQKLSKDGFKALAPTVARLAALEELEAHKRAVTLRLKEISE